MPKTNPKGLCSFHPLRGRNQKQKYKMGVDILVFARSRTDHIPLATPASLMHRSLHRCRRDHPCPIAFTIEPSAEVSQSRDRRNRRRRHSDVLWRMG